MDSFNQIVAEQAKILANKPTWSAISAENVAKMKIQNRFKTGTEIAKYCSEIMRKDIAEFEADDTKYTQSLGCWHGYRTGTSKSSAALFAGCGSVAWLGWQACAGGAMGRAEASWAVGQGR